MTVPKTYHMLDTARQLRKNMTPQEAKLWYQFLRKHPAKFYKQRIVRHFIVDFYCAKAKLVIEIDGSQHYEGNGPEYDAERTAILEGYGLKVIRFANNEVDENFNGVCAEIERVVKERMGE